MTNRNLPLFGLFLLVVAVTACRNDRDLEEVNRSYDSVSNLLDEQRKVSDSLQQLVHRTEEYENQIFFGKAFDSIENPEEYITDRLRQKPDIIPLDPVLGGTMEFRKIEVLTEEWILAQYDDGHIQGKSILSYRKQPDGDLDFKIITSSLPE